jgi:O-antigen ligase
VWMIYIIFQFFIDRGISLYEEDILSASAALETINPKVFVLRNTFIYIPVVFFLLIRGLTKKELKIFLTFVFLISPIAIIVFLDSSRIGNFGELQESMVENSNYGLLYNLFPQSITFAIITGLYLMKEYKHKIFKFFILLLLVFDLLFIVISKSRQTLLFTVIILIIYIYFNFVKIKLKYFLFSIIAFVFILILFDYIFSISDELKQYLFSRYTSDLFDTNRFLIMQEGIELIGGFFNWIIGNGITSVIYSGPHNNYIRLVQKIGIIGLLLTYIPFFMALSKSIKMGIRYRRHQNFENNLVFLIVSTLLFPVFHSFFGYPFDEVYNAPIIWQGLCFYFIFKNRLIAENINPEIDDAPSFSPEPAIKNPHLFYPTDLQRKQF